MPKKRHGLWKVIFAILLAILVGSWSGTSKTLFGVNLYSIFDLLGALFINALSLVVVPLVSSSIISGVAKIGSEEEFGRLGIKTFGYYILTSILAILIGLIFINLFKPGITAAGDPLLGTYAQNAEHLQGAFFSGQSFGVVRIILQIVPSNIMDAFASGNMLGLIFFSILFGYAISKIRDRSSKVLIHFFQGLFQSMIHITHLFIHLLPFGVFFLVAKAFATTAHGFSGLGYFFLSVLLGLSFFLFAGLPLLIRFIGKVSPFSFFRSMYPALFTAFSTSSSSATLPVTLDCIEKRAGVSNRIASLVIPLGGSINMSGSALYELVAAMFVIQAYGVHLSLFHQLFLSFIALLTSIGVAGVPSGSLVAIIMILKTVGLPTEGIGLFIALDRLLDMCRTTVNVFSDSTCALLVARSEGEKTLLLPKALKGRRE